MRLTREDLEISLLHTAFGLLAVVVLLLPLPVDSGPRVFGLVLTYNIAIPLLSRFLGRPEWFDIWLFVLPLSVFQVYPDWFLSQQLKILVFPADGFPKIGTVSAYMAGMWAIPLFLCVYIARRVRPRSIPGAYIAAAATALLIFAFSEATLWTVPIWHAQNVTMLGMMAVYVIPAEVLLGMATYRAYEETRGRNLLYKIPAAFIVMVLYLGSVAGAYFAVDVLLKT